MQSHWTWLGAATHLQPVKFFSWRFSSLAAIKFFYDDTNPDARTTRLIADRARKAWRWAGEMEEIAASFDSVSLPSGFLANAEIYRRLAAFKDCGQPPSLEEISTRLRQDPAA